MQFDSNQAIYLQIVDEICAYIVSAKWPQDERIPSVRELSVQLEVNPNTVLRSYDMLQSEGIIYNKRGIGYFVASDGQEKAKTYLRAKFTQTDMPQFFKQMNILGISFNELEKFYQLFMNQLNLK
ncbi:MAG TPA: GntR family transcriptional regulator [Bacteroidales bacterium]|jgi:DNA-binding transcriptional regulator YhcF (GntR family)|nr:GntR family transcriptional regulator [Bacteroidales bacterium]HNV95159.1 GntR family transcriptional regulator [Bacteroidales bacterium]HOU97298.1 GntR family transcriptional regulator [Bacteroidales bacterium]